jgi:hypothetical protein
MEGRKNTNKEIIKYENVIQNTKLKLKKYTFFKDQNYSSLINANSCVSGN